MIQAANSPSRSLEKKAIPTPKVVPSPIISPTALATTQRHQRSVLARLIMVCIVGDQVIWWSLFGYPCQNDYQSLHLFQPG